MLSLRLSIGPPKADRQNYLLNPIAIGSVSKV